MVFNDTTNRQGLIQDIEDSCGLGATGITGDTARFQQFTRWANLWNKKGANYAILAFDGHDFDDPGYTTAPTGTFTGTTSREYIFDATYKAWKVKIVNISYDGTNYVAATPFDNINQRQDALNDPNVDAKFDQSAPKYDQSASGFKIYPKFTAAQVSAGAKVYVEWYRSPREFATSGTDDYEPGFDSQFHNLVSKGASLEYCTIYRPDLATQLKIDIYGNGGNIKGILKELQEWYNSKTPSNGRMTVRQESTR